MKNQEVNSTMQEQERTLFALERTFSAWLRTALTAMAGGIAILRLISFKTDMHKMIAHIVGETLILWGAVVIVLSSIDYKRVRDKLALAKNYKGSGLGFAIIVIPLLLISLLLVWVTLP
ncbi:MAG: YidH family protein [Candidatus Babeliales bacterium]